MTPCNIIYGPPKTSCTKVYNEKSASLASSIVRKQPHLDNDAVDDLKRLLLIKSDIIEINITRETLAEIFFSKFGQQHVPTYIPNHRKYQRLKKTST